MKKLSATLVIFILLLTPSFTFAKPGKGGGNGKDDFQPIPYSVCLDPGHGGSETGTVNLDLKESVVNLEVATLVKDKLISYGYYEEENIFMTREDDSEKTNADRYNYCNSQKAALLISIHHNGSINPEVDYTSALYFKKADRQIANLVAQKISQALGLENKGISRFASGVLLKSKMPATISEGFFLTSSNEYNLIKNSDRLEQEAEAIVSAINAYFGK